MTFKKQFNDIKSVVADDLDCLEKGISDLFTEKNALNKDLSEFLMAPAKRLRPLLGFLLLRCVFGEINRAQQDVLLSVELIHNATLIHDDVIDKADKRRNQETLNVKFDDNLAVVAGDFLLSVAMEKVISTGSIEVLKIFVSALKSTCIGEINQHFSKFGITTIDEYIEKSRQKTALLFQIGASSGLLLGNKNVNNELKQTIIDISQNFGIAFQIRDDLINVLNSNNASTDDISSGIYTAPAIFAHQENNNILNEENIKDAIKLTRGIEKTKNLMDNYFSKSTLAIQNLEDNIYRQKLLELVELFRIIYRREKCNQKN